MHRAQSPLWATVVLLLAGGAGCAWAQPVLSDRWVGDIGGATYLTQRIVPNGAAQHSLLPYAYLDHGRFFVRVDTLGVKTLPVGQGHLELAARISLEGFAAKGAALHGIADRRNPVPVGLGTYQETPFGAFFLHSFHDMRSGGSLSEATYAAEWRAGGVAFYPQLGVERRSRRYLRQLYGVSPAEAQASAYPVYRPGASTLPVAGLAVEWPIRAPWSLNLQWRRKWLDSAITRSPLVNTTVQDSGFVAVTYAIK